MSCSICNGHVGCPICAPACRREDCPSCEGSGFHFHSASGDQITKKEYDTLNKADRTKALCSVCEGVGEIYYEYAR